MKQLLLSILKYISLPFALLYGIVVFLRNKFYDWEIFTSIEFSLPVICVGNITVGGTGKSPHIEYLIELLSPMYKVATLSRGYRRHSRGFRLANDQSDAREIGDEPFQFKSKYPQIDVAVAEERMTAIPQLLQLRQDTQIILLDDAFQHRTVRAGMNIVLTDYGRRYTKDFIMPFGLLRESRSAASRADLILITKCPHSISSKEKKALIQEINPLSHQQIYFSSIQYKQLYPLTSFGVSPTKDTEILLVTGIANPSSLKEKLESQFKAVYSLSFKDHHYFSFDDLNEINEAFQHLKSEHKIIVTTEKDAARLMLLKDKINELQLPFFAQSIGIEVLFNEQEKFNQQILDFIHHYIPHVIENHVEDEQSDDQLITN
jgi:tetraacyldisaccharide 4'-kinase